MIQLLDVQFCGVQPNTAMPDPKYAHFSLSAANAAKLEVRRTLECSISIRSNEYLKSLYSASAATKAGCRSIVGKSGSANKSARVPSANQPK